MKAGHPDGLRHIPALGLGPSLLHPSRTEPRGMTARRKALGRRNRDFSLTCSLPSSALWLQSWQPVVPDRLRPDTTLLLLC